MNSNIYAKYNKIPDITNHGMQENQIVPNKKCHRQLLKEYKGEKL